MQKIFYFITSLLITIILIPPFTPLASNKIPFPDLIEKGAYYDGKTLTLEGEAIGEYLERDEYGWVNISDGSMAIGIWVNATEGLSVKNYGDYKNKGDIVETTGVFNKACKEHGGDMDFHSTDLKIVTPGSSTHNPINKITLLLSLALSPIVIIFLSILFKKSNSPI